MIVSAEDQGRLCEELRRHDLLPAVMDPAGIKTVQGHIGNFRVSIESTAEIATMETDQIIWFHAPSTIPPQRGVYDPTLSVIPKIVEEVISSHGDCTYKNHIKYSPHHCQYHHKRKTVCGHCADSCPASAITRADQPRELDITDINCVGCGRCAATCPTGAIECATMPRRAFDEILGFFRNRVALILPNGEYIESLRLDLPEKVLPLFVEQEAFLDEAHLLSLLQTTGHPILFYSEKLSALSAQIVYLLNEISRRRWNREAIYVCSDAAELEAGCRHISALPESIFDIGVQTLSKREIFMQRLAHLVGDCDFGTIQTGPLLHYGDLTVDEKQCTLCLSCAAACDTGALTAHDEDNTLRFHPSLCTGCGYCAMTCPESDCLQVSTNRLALRPDLFRQRVVARDTIFPCVECGKGFAPAKAIEKVAAMMKPLFDNDSVKIKSLYCCPDCKAKIMLEALHEGEIHS